MKDTFTKKVTAISSCLADCAEITVGQTEEDNNKLVSSDKNRVRRSAAVIGLAISMSATGMVYSQGKAAIAANSITANKSLPTLPAPSNLEKDQRKLAPLSLKHEVQPGETIKQLAQAYQVDPDAIIASNNLAIAADLEPGQTIKIPAIKKTVSDSSAKQSGSQMLRADVTAAKPLNTSLDHLRETRKRLQDSLVELKTEKSKPDAQRTKIVADVSDVSQSLVASKKQPELTRISLQTEVNQSEEPIKLPAFSVENEKTATTSSSLVELPEVQSQTVNSSSPPSPDKLTGIRVSRKEETTPAPPSLSAIPSVPSVKEQTALKVESKRPVPLSIESPEAGISEEGQDIETNSPQQTSFKQPTLVVPKPQFAPTKKSYQVRPGDTVNSIARQHGISTAELIRANGITNPNLIKVNQTLTIPQKGKVADAEQQKKNLPSSTLAASVNALQLREDSASNGFITPNNRRTLESEISIVQESHTDKLKADIVSLQQNYGQRSESISINNESDRVNKTDQTVVGESLNSEWASTRQTDQSLQEDIDQRLNSQESQVVGSAPTDPGFYNDAFHIPVGTNVGPELPGLSNPDDYLPDAPMKFNGHIWPSKGVLTSGYGPRWGRMHKGIDIAAPVGTPIVASAPGEVISAGWNSGGYGNLVKVRHPDGSVTLYAHNSRILVRNGQKVEQGQQISEMGSTGFSTGPHLHFEIHPGGGSAQNPMAFLPKKRP
ncbi:MAG: peptidoglycan DD-metalloendopeptidase family protein [Cyanobacteria bacterium P01_G01_bin.49]